MRKYYKKTHLLQKIWKIIRLYTLLGIAILKPRRVVKSQGYAVLNIVSELDRVGGLELQALELCGALTRQADIVVILTDVAGGRSSKEFRNGFLIYRLPFDSRPGNLSLAFATLLFFMRHVHAFDIIHAHGVTGFTLFALRIGKWMNRPNILIATTKDDFVNIFSKHDFKHRIYQRWLKEIDCYIAISEELVNEMLSCGIAKSRIRRIPNFVNSIKFAPPSPERRAILRSQFSINGDQIVYLFLGRLVERKGADVLLKAWQKASPGVLWIVGEGPEGELLRNLAKDLKLKNVFFFGETSHPLDFYQAADVFVMPSRKEGFPCVTLEAMSCGLPCIATLIGGIVDQIENEKEGLLIPPDSVEALADAIRKIAKDHQSREKWHKQTLHTVRERYDISVAAAHYHSLYAELAN